MECKKRLVYNVYFTMFFNDDLVILILIWNSHLLNDDNIKATSEVCKKSAFANLARVLPIVWYRHVLRH